MAKYSRAPGGEQVFHLDGRPYGYESVIVIPEGDWRRTAELLMSMMGQCRCGDCNCRLCREDAEIKAIIERTEAANG